MIRYPQKNKQTIKQSAQILFHSKRPRII